MTQHGLCALLLVSGWPVFAAALPERYDRWLKHDAAYVISDEERKSFLQLTTDQARDNFMADFWEARNPMPGSGRNPFREEHFRRMEYADEHFGKDSGTPGWKTDMGRTWILFGKPESRAVFKGYAEMYPLELWFYSNNSGSHSLPSFFYVLFFLPEDIGEYRYYHPITDGPLKLVRGARFQSNADVYGFLKRLGGDLAHAAFSLDPTDPIDTNTFSPSIAGEMVVSRIQNFANDPERLKKIREARYLKEKVSSWMIVAQQKPLTLKSIVLADPDGRYWLDYAVLVDNPEYGRAVPGGAALMLNAGFRLFDGKDALVAEDSEERAFPAFESGRFSPFAVGNRIPLVPGQYKLEVTLTNREAQRSYKAKQQIVAGAGNSVSLSGPLLSAAVERPAHPDPDAAFQYYGVQVLPNLDRSFSSRDRLRTMVCLRAPAGDTRDFEVEYVLAHSQDRTVRNTMKDRISASEFKNGSLIKIKTFPLEALSAGDYRLLVHLRAAGSQEVTASAVEPFRIGERSAEPALYLLSNFRGSLRNGVAAYVRGLEFLAQNDRPSAVRSLEESLYQNPANAFAGLTLIQIYFTEHRYAEVTALYGRIGIAPLKASPEALAQVALSYSETGDAERARRVLSAARDFFPQNPLLVAAAKTVAQHK